MDERSAVTPQTVVRTNWLRFSWNRISGSNKVLLIFTTLLSLLQIITTAIILGIGGQQHLSCNKPLQMYLILYVIRVGVSLPFSIYQHLTTPRSTRGRRRRGGGEGQRRRTRQIIHTVPDIPVPASTTTTDTNNNNITAMEPPSTSNQGSSSNNNTQANEVEQQPATLITGWANRIKSLLDLFAVLWFIVGNYLVYAPSDCTMNAGLYYYTILTFVIFGYIILLLPVLVCASVLFCLPCVLVATRVFGINFMEGGSKEDIANIPIFRYKSPNSDDEDSSPPKDNNNTADHEQQQEPPNKRKRFYFFKTTTKENEDTKHYDTLTIPKPEDAVCSICLCEYEDNELICKLWCDHLYHKDCVHEWLGLNSTCPLCKRDFRGKDYEDEDSEEEGVL